MDVMDNEKILEMSKTDELTEQFIESYADKIGDSIWISLIRNQRHIKPDFFYRFGSDFGIHVHVILLRRVLSDVLKKISL